MMALIGKSEKAGKLGRGCRACGALSEILTDQKNRPNIGAVCEWVLDN